jgi:hypothetical protein
MFDRRVHPPCDASVNPISAALRFQDASRSQASYQSQTIIAGKFRIRDVSISAFPQLPKVHIRHAWHPTSATLRFQYVCLLSSFLSADCANRTESGGRILCVVLARTSLPWKSTGRLCYFGEMKQRIRDLLRAIPFQPFVIRMAGREYRVEHQDFVLAAASDIPQITLEEPDGSQHYLSALLVTSIERIGPVTTDT